MSARGPAQGSEESGVTFQSHIRRLDPCAHGPSCSIGKSRGCSARISRCSSMNASNSPASEEVIAKAMPSVAALGGGAARLPSASSPARRCSDIRPGRVTVPYLRVESARELVGLDLEGLRPSAGSRLGEPQLCHALHDRVGGATSAAREATLSDGRRHAGRHRRGGAARGRHVRLRDAHPRRAPRHWPIPGQAGSTSRMPAYSRGLSSPPSRPSIHLPRLQRLFPALSAPPRAQPTKSSP